MNYKESLWKKYNEETGELENFEFNLEYEVIDADSENKACRVMYLGKTIEFYFDMNEHKVYGKDDEAEYIFPDLPGGGWIETVFKYENFDELVNSFEFMQAVRFEMMKKGEKSTFRVFDVGVKRNTCHMEYNGKIYEVFYDYYMGDFRVTADDDTEYVFPHHPGGGWLSQVFKKYDNFSDRVNSHEFMMAVTTEMRDYGTVKK